MALVTTEVRWIVEGSRPPSVIDWFDDRVGQVAEEPPRTDRYLVVGTDDLGIKLRDGRIEVKGLMSAAGVFEAGPRAAGVIQRWSKWWAPDPGMLDWPRGHELALAEDMWIAVSKTRLMARLLVGADGEVGPVAAEADIGNASLARDAAAIAPETEPLAEGRDEGHGQPDPDGAGRRLCHVELAGISSIAGQHWTVALEVNEGDAAAASAMAAVCRHLFSERVPTRLRASDSLSYPAWLAQL